MSQSGETKRSSTKKYLDRRRFLMASGAVAGTGVLTGCLHDGEPADTDGNDTDGNETDGEDDMPERGTVEYLQQKYPGLTILSPDPENAQAAAREVYDDQFITPREDHYIRNHYTSPDIDADEWSLTMIVGDEEIELSVQEIIEDYSTETVTHTMQCSGNGRSFFDPQVGGNQWHYGAVGNAQWTGTPVSEVLEDHDAPTEDGMWLRVTGGDNPEGEDYFTRSIPMEKVMEDCLFAYQMNGDDISMEHGHPLRFIVPGWFGCNNVKWLAEAEVMDTMVFGPEWEDRPEAYTEAGMDYDGDGQRTYTHWQQYSYRVVPDQDERALHYENIDVYDTREQMENTDEIRNAYMYDQLVKSTIGAPGEDSTVEAGEHEVFGVAWAGDDSVETVEVSADGGETWEEAELVADDQGREGPYSWTMFRYMWDAEPGEYTLVSRATDENDRTQPREISDPEDELRGIEDDKYPWNKGGYGMNAYMAHAVEVTVEQQ